MPTQNIDLGNTNLMTYKAGPGAAQDVCELVLDGTTIWETTSGACGNAWGEIYMPTPPPTIIAPGPLQVGNYLPGVLEYGLAGGSDIMGDGSPKDTYFLISGEINNSEVLIQGTHAGNSLVIQTGVLTSRADDRYWHDFAAAGIYDSPNKKNYEITKVGVCVMPPTSNQCNGYSWTGAAANPGVGGMSAVKRFDVAEITDQFLPGGTRWEVRSGTTLQFTSTFFYPQFFGGSDVTHFGNVRSVTPGGTVTDSQYTFHFGSSASPHGLGWVVGGTAWNLIPPGGTWGTSLYPVGTVIGVAGVGINYTRTM